MKRFKVLNYAMEPGRLLSESEVPTLVPSEKLAVLTNGDGAPYYKIQAIKYPVRGTGGIYEEAFFQSFVDVTKERPIPGAKRGHWTANRGASDFYMIGGRVDSNGDGTGTVYFKNYIPPKGDGTDNERFIQDAKAGIVHFSLVSAPAYTVDEYGIYHFTASQGYERNDAVEYGTGAMKQQTNAEEDEAVQNLKARIMAGDVDRTSAWKADNSGAGELWELTDDEGTAYQFGRNGKVFRSALRSIASRAANSEPGEIASRMLTLMDSEGVKMNKDEMLAKLANMKTNGELTNVEIAKVFGLKLENSEELTALKTENAALNAKVQETEAVRVNALLDKEFGSSGLLRDYAGKMLNSADPVALENFKKDPVALQLAGMKTDITVAVVDNSGKVAAPKMVAGVAIVEV